MSEVSIAGIAISMSSVENGMLQRDELRKINKDKGTKFMETTTIKKMINIKLE